MVSAADRVFAITEILLQILLDCNLSTRELFLIQTVNRSFHHAVNGSTTMLRTMEILHKPTDQKRYRIVNPILWTEQLELRTHYRTVVLSPASPRNSGTGWKVNVEVTINVAEYDDANESGPGDRIGVKSNKFFVNPRDGTWRRMKITRFPVVIEVPMRINCMDSFYEESTIDTSGEMTLGFLADFIDNARSRSMDEHLQKIVDFQALSLDEVEEERTETAGCNIS